MQLFIGKKKVNDKKCGETRKKKKKRLVERFHDGETDSRRKGWSVECSRGSVASSSYNDRERNYGMQEHAE